MSMFGESEFVNALIRIKCIAFDLSVAIEAGGFNDAQRARVLVGLCDAARFMFNPGDDEDARRVRAFLERLCSALSGWADGAPVRLEDAVLLRRLGFYVRADDISD